METIDRITLDCVLPDVFIGAESDSPVSRSRVWLRSVSFERPGRYLVMAESGTGKSSLCSFLYGNRRDYQGRILFNGTDIRSFSIGDWCEVRRRHLALLPQEMRLFPELTAMENIRMKNRLTDCCSESAIMEMLASLEVDNKASQPASRLSIGQQQRVALVRALCQPFDVLLLDEPVSHLDERNNALAAALVERVAAERSAMVITTSVGNHLALDGPERISL